MCYDIDIKIDWYTRSHVEEVFYCIVSGRDPSTDKVSGGSIRWWLMDSKASQPVTVIAIADRQG